jgi:hypothetical protein
MHRLCRGCHPVPAPAGTTCHCKQY